MRSHQGRRPGRWVPSVCLAVVAIGMCAAAQGRDAKPPAEVPEGLGAVANGRGADGTIQLSPRILAYHFDMKRPMWKREYMEQMVEHLKAWGFTHIVYELEDKFQFANHPDLRHPEAPSHAEHASFVSFCREKGMEVIPLMQSLGHLEFVTSKPRYAHLRESPDVKGQIDPLSEEGRALLIEMFDEIIEVMQPTEFFHIGGDEAFKLGTSEKSRPVVAEIGKGGLYLQHMMPLLEHIHDKGLRPMIWADMFLSHPEVLSEIPPYVVLVDWNYRTVSGTRTKALHVWGDKQYTWEQYQKVEPPSFTTFLERYAVDEQTKKDGTFRAFYSTDALRAYGMDVITASASRSMWDTAGTPDLGFHTPNCFHSARKGASAGMGTLVTSWAVRSNHPELGLVAAFASSYALQNEGEYDFNRIAAAFAESHFGVPMPEFGEALSKAGLNLPWVIRAGWSALSDKWILAGPEDSEAKEDWLRSDFRRLPDSGGSFESGYQKILDSRKAFAEAKEMLENLKPKARTNAHNLDFWIEGIDYNLFRVEFLIGAIDGSLREDAPALLERLDRLRETTVDLFSETYLPKGMEYDIDRRYDRYERLLKRLAGVQTSAAE